FALLPPDNATGNFVKVTQRVPVKIEIENFNEYKNLLRAGMSVTVEVKK
ncbi:MAG TPA: HlyD family secretion protein, partial [Bacteroidia bacterium]|nr:HlyD family secretion protein [Bacteroidia bacterium]